MRVSFTLNKGHDSTLGASHENLPASFTCSKPGFVRNYVIEAQCWFPNNFHLWA